MPRKPSLKLRQSQPKLDTSGGLLRPRHAFELLGVGRSVGWELVRAGKLVRVVLPGMTHPRITRESVDALIREGIERGAA